MALKQWLSGMCVAVVLAAAPGLAVAGEYVDPYAAVTDELRLYVANLFARNTPCICETEHCGLAKALHAYTTSQGQDKLLIALLLERPEYGKVLWVLDDRVMPHAEMNNTSPMQRVVELMYADIDSRNTQTAFAQIANAADGWYGELCEEYVLKLLMERPSIYAQRSTLFCYYDPWIKDELSYRSEAERQAARSRYEALHSRAGQDVIERFFPAE